MTSFFHDEPVDAGKDEFESFILGKGVSESRGSLIAPFPDGPGGEAALLPAVSKAQATITFADKTVSTGDVAVK